jgi:hypothetical protein
MLAVHQPGVAGILGRFGWSGCQAPSMLEFVRRDIEDGVRRNRFTRMPITLAFNIVTGAAMSAMHRMLETECRDDFSNWPQPWHCAPWAWKARRPTPYPARR